MNFRTPLILLGVFCAFVVAFFVLQKRGVETPSERKERQRWLLPSMHAPGDQAVKVTDITRIEIQRKEKPEQLVFEKEGEDWRMVAPRKVRTNSAHVDRMLGDLISAQRIKDAHLTAGAAEYGLDQPATVVTLQHKNQTKYVIKFGKQSPHKEPVVYVQSSDSGEDPLAVEKRNVDKVFGTVEDFRARELLTTPFGDVVGVRIAGAGKEPVALKKVDKKDWLFKEPSLGEADNGVIEEFVRKLPTIRVEKSHDFVAEGSVDLAKYALEKDKAAVVVTLYQQAADAKEPTAETLYIGVKDPEKLALRHAATVGGMLAPSARVFGLPILAALAAGREAQERDKDAGGTFAKLASEDYVVRIDGEHLKMFNIKPDDWRNKSLLPRAVQQKIDKADVMDLLSGGDSLKLRRADLKVSSDDDKPPASPWELYTEYRGKMKTHPRAVESLLDALKDIALKDSKAFLDNDKKTRDWFGSDTIDLGLDKPQAELRLWVEGIKRDKDGKPEGDPKPKDEVKDKPNVKLVFGKKDDKHGGGVIYVRREVDGDPKTATVLAVPDPWVSGVTERPQFQGMPPPPRKTVSISSLVTGGYLAFRDHRLPGFAIDKASRMTYVRGGETFVLEKGEKKDEKDMFPDWNLKQPVERKNVREADMLLFSLSNLQVEKLINDKASDQDRAKHGLADRPTIKVTVSVQDGDKKKDYSYFIGKAKPDDKPKDPLDIGLPKRDSFYARMEVQPPDDGFPDANQFVFTLNPNVVQVLDAEFRDTTIFPDDKTLKPEEIIFIWRDKEKKEETRLELVYKAEKDGADKTWTVKSLTVNGKDAKESLPKLDAAKVDRLVGTGRPSFPAFGEASLSHVRTERYLGKPEPKHRLDPANKDNPPLLAVEVKYDNKTSRTLTLGDRWKPTPEEAPGLASRTSFYATASSQPGMVFVLDEQNWKDIVAGMNYLKAGDKVAAQH